MNPANPLLGGAEVGLYKKPFIVFNFRASF